MPTSLVDWEQKRSKVLAAFSQLEDLRPGSITKIFRRCGKPSCHCARPQDPGHGPSLRLTYKTEGKTVSEALPSSAAVRKAEREINEFRKFQQLSRSFLEINAEICRLRPMAAEAQSTQEKKLPKRFIRKSLKK